MAELFVHVGELEIWTEHFGDKKNPPILLIMGAAAQGIFWPDVFCESLADRGFFVIRYDHRCTGQSSSIDFGKNPYTIDDLTKDAVAILDAYSIDQAHIVGTSLGGFIGLCMALSFTQRVRSLVLLMSSCDLSVVVDTILGIDISRHVLPRPRPEYVSLIRKLIRARPKTKRAFIDAHIKMLKIISGTQTFDEQEIIKMVTRACDRVKKYDAMVNIGLAITASRAHIDNLADITVPTLIFEAEKDPVFPVGHGDALAHGIAQSTLIKLANVAHFASDQVFMAQILPVMVDFLKRN
ncbi:MAG: alpha/beta fold hydrolase [bacterium]|nr:alpha/beta fold hydrolase [bacterium]